MKQSKQQQWIATFFEEKDLPLVQWEIDHDDMTHIISNEAIIEVLKFSTGDGDLVKIINVLSQIDFHNGDVNHFLKHLAEGYIKMNY